MSHVLAIVLEVPNDLARFRLPQGVDSRLTSRLDRQDRGLALSAEERREAERLVDLAELLSVLKRRAERGANPR